MEENKDKVRYDYNRLRRDLQDEYMAAMLVGASENTPDLMDLQFAPNEMLPEAAKRLGYDINDYIITDFDEEEYYRLREKAIKMNIRLE